MGESLTGRVAVVTGAGAGLGRAEALALAAEGASVVVNDISDADVDAVVAEIVAAGGAAASCLGDVSEWAVGEALLATALEQFGSADILVNNAGIVRDRMVFNMSEQEWDDVIRVHLKGHFVTTRLFAAHWRARSRQADGEVYARVVNTASEAFLTGSPGQANYASAKAGIAALTLSTARGCRRYGVRANAICPRARTAMTESVFDAAPIDGPDPMSAEQVAPLVGYLSGPDAGSINGQVFVVYGGKVDLMAAPQIETTFRSSGTWSVEEMNGQLSEYFSDRDPAQTFSALSVLG